MEEENKIIRKRVIAKGHPNSGFRGQIFYYRLIASKILGKALSEKTVIHHHSVDQLVICENTSYHHILHTRERAFNATGNPNKRKCLYCKKWDMQNNLQIKSASYLGSFNYYHIDCHKKYQDLYNLERRLS